MNDIMHLAKITYANLKNGSVMPSETEIEAAMLSAISKEKDMAEQLYKSHVGDRCVFDLFRSEMSAMIHTACTKDML